MTQEQAKVEKPEGEVEKPAKEPAPEVEEKPGAKKEPAAKVEPPEKGLDEGEITPENAVQRAKTYQGMLTKTQQELATLQQARSDFSGLSLKVDNIHTQIEQQGQTLDLVVEAISNSTDASEEFQTKVSESRDRVSKQRLVYTQATQTLEHIQGLSKAAGMTLEDETLKPAKEAFEKGETQKALELTIVAVKGKVTSPPKSETPEEDKDKEPKSNLKNLKKTPAPAKASDELTTDEKIARGIEEAKAKQD